MAPVFNVKILSDDSQVRSVKKPTRAALDFMAYCNNPIRLAGKFERPEQYIGKMDSVSLEKYPFPMLDSLSLTMPSAVTGKTPVAWEPFSRILREKTGSDSLSTALLQVTAVKWGELSVFRTFQEVTRLWGGLKNGKMEWWVEVTPASWTHHRLFFGHLKNAPQSPKGQSVLQNYQTHELNLDETVTWARTLSSYWYPTLNTDLEVHTPGTEWRGEKPFAVMRGNPMGKPIWIAFDVPRFRLTKEQIQKLNRPVSDSIIQRTMDTSSTFRLQTLESLKNACPETTAEKIFNAALSKILDSLPAEQNAWSHGGMLWFRRNVNYLLSDSISSQDSLHNPLPRLLALKAALDSMQIQLLVVPVPVKEEIYPDFLVPGTSSDLCVDPSGRRFMREMLAEGLDVLDLYPALKAAKAGDTPPNFVFQRYDTHWAKSGLLAAMEQLASRVTQYSWYPSSGARPGMLQLRDTIILREGDLVSHLPAAEKVKYAPDTLRVSKVYTSKGKPYKGGTSAPILLMGDSFTGVFESVDQRSGGPGSLLAFATGLDVQVLTSWGGGPSVRHRLFRSKKALTSKRLVIYMMTARDFWQSPMEWDAVN